MISKIKKIIPVPIKSYIRKKTDTFFLGRKFKKETIRKLTHKIFTSRIILIGTPNYGNLGDHAITEAELKFFSDILPNSEVIEVSADHYKYDTNGIVNEIVNSDIIVLTGGGFLGNLWMEAEEMFRDILLKFPDNKIICMPQTIYFDDRYDKNEEILKSKKIYESHNDVTLFLRESNSYDFALNTFDTEKIKVKLVPDIVAYMEPKVYAEQGKSALFIVRNDKEKLNNNHVLNYSKELLINKQFDIKYQDNVVNKKLDEYTRGKYLHTQFKEIQSSKIVITDRLHGMLFSLINGVPCIALDNVSGKVKGVYQWLKNYNYVKCIDNEINKEELESLINELTSINSTRYHNNRIIKDFKPLIEEFERITNEY